MLRGNTVYEMIACCCLPVKRGQREVDDHMCHGHLRFNGYLPCQYRAKWFCATGYSLTAESLPQVLTYQTTKEGLLQVR